MKLENLKRANEISRRLNELEKLKSWVNDSSIEIYCIASNCDLNVREIVAITPKMRKMIKEAAENQEEELRKEIKEL